MNRAATYLVFVLAVAAGGPAWAGDVVLGPRVEFLHPGHGHEVHVSPPAVAVTADGTPLVAWAASEGNARPLYFGRVEGGTIRPVRVSPEHLNVDSLHQAPGLVVGAGGEVYVSWSSDKPKPEGTLFASDLRLSRSLDGGVRFDAPLRVNEDRPISHSFEGLGVASDGTVVLSWIDSREGPDRAGTYVARIADRGSRVASRSRLDDITCVCCRVAVATGPANRVMVAWRRVLPGNIRDMVASVSRDGGQAFTAPALVHADQWKIAACPHRGGKLAFDAGGRAYLAWYTEGADDQPRLLLAVAPDGQRFGPPATLTTATGAVPDHLRLAVASDGRAVMVWEESTAVRRRVLMRHSLDGGRTLGEAQTLSSAVRAFAPDVTITPAGQFVVVWHEEQFPTVKTVVQAVTVGPAR
jgi:hypothetical protein